MIEFFSRKVKFQMKSFKERLGKEILFFDGAMGTQIQALGIEIPSSPEDLNVLNPEAIYSIHEKYLQAGADIILANTFGANKIKYRGDYSVPEVVKAGVEIARKAILDSGKNAYVAIDIGATGKLLEPYGELSFTDAYNAFAELVKAGADAGADIVSIETMMDIHETKLAVLAAKENCSLPVTVTVSFNESGKTLTGASPAVVATTLDSLGVDAIGINCGLGPEQCVSMLAEMRKYTCLPIAVSPNAGLPVYVDGGTVYPLGAEEFASLMGAIYDNGASVLGGCCGTTPEHIKALTELHKGKEPISSEESERKAYVASRSKVLPLEGTVRIGERLNTAKNPEFLDAVREEDQYYIEDEAMAMEDAEADVISIKVSGDDIDESSAIVQVIRSAQSMSNVPFMIEADSLKALEAALRVCNGRPLVRWSEECGVSMNFARMVAKKYGALAVTQTDEEDIDGDGIVIGTLKLL